MMALKKMASTLQFQLASRVMVRIGNVKVRNVTGYARKNASRFRSFSVYVVRYLSKSNPVYSVSDPDPGS
jgi:hypothetical protein